METRYTISAHLKGGGHIEEKEYYVYCRNEEDEKKRIEECLRDDKRIESWDVKNREVVDQSEGINPQKAHMLGVWYDPIE